MSSCLRLLYGGRRLLCGGDGGRLLWGSSRFGLGTRVVDSNTWGSRFTLDSGACRSLIGICFLY
jgi:hypothetical protein